MFLAAKQLGSEEAKCDLDAKTQRCEDAKRQSLLRNILISPLEGEKKFLGELNELRNFREGVNLKLSCRNSNSDLPKQLRCIPLNKLMMLGRKLNLFFDTVFSRFTSHFSRKCTAFTLAEVLITLGIIGIVVALTVPNLVQGYRKHVVETRLKEFYTITQQAFKMAEVDNGDIANWGRYGNPGNVYVENDVYHSNSDEWFDKYISPYLKEEKRDLGVENFTESRILRVLPNGSAFAFNVNAITFFPFADDYYKCAQYGNDLIKKCSGRKYFLFKYYQDSRITPFDYPNHSTKLSLEYSDYRNRLRRERLVGSIGSCSKKSIEANREAHYCAELIMLEGWKIPKDYPFRF